MPSELVESELFGYRKGAFTGAHIDRAGKFEFANGGTIFLDEIGEFTSSIQAKLLQVLQEGRFTRLGSNRETQVDVRIVAATNRNGNDRVKVTHCDHGIMTRPPTTLFSFKCLSPRYLEALKEKTAGSLLRYQTGPKWVTFALAKSAVEVSTGKSSLSVTKELAFHQLGGHRRAVHLDKGFIAQIGLPMDHAGNQVFPYTAFSLNQHRNLSVSNLENGFVNALHFGTADHQINLFGFSFGESTRHMICGIEGAGDGLRKLLELNGLANVVPDPGLNRLDNNLRIS